MEKILILTPAQANAIKGKHGIYSEIDPIAIPDGNYMIPEKCISDPDLISIKETILSMNANTQELDKIPDVGEKYTQVSYMNIILPKLILIHFNQIL